MKKPVYSRKEDQRQFNEYVYEMPNSVNSFVDKVLKKEILEARKRISVFYEGGKKYHRYDPSPEYKEAIKRFVNKNLKH